MFMTSTATMDSHPCECHSTQENVSSHKPVLYCSWFCPYAQRVWIALNEKNVTYSYEEINPYESHDSVIKNDEDSSPKSSEITMKCTKLMNKYTKIPLSIERKKEKYPEWMAASPKGLVPALRLDKQQTVCDSMVCLEFIDEQWATANTTSSNSGVVSFLPGEPIVRAKVRYWCGFANERIIPYYYKMLMAPEQEDRKEAKEKILMYLAEFAGAMRPLCSDNKDGEDGVGARDADDGVGNSGGSSNNSCKVTNNVGEGCGPYFLGAEYSMVDITLFPWYERLLTVSAAYRGFSVPVDRLEFQRLHQWYLAVRGRAAVQSTLADTKDLIANYAGYADNSATSDAALKFSS